MKQHNIAAYVGVVIVLALLVYPCIAGETTWRHSGFELWGYDINMTNLNISNGQLIDAKIINGVVNAGEYDTIQDAINATATGGILIIPQGSYTENIIISNAITIRGSGSAGTIFNNLDATSTVITIAAWDVSLSDFSITNTTGQQTSGNGIWINNTASVRTILENINLNNQSTGINITGSNAGYGFFLNRLDIRESVLYGIRIDGGNDHFLSNIVLDSTPDALNTTAQIKIIESGATWISNVDAIHGTRNLLLEGVVGKSISWFFISDSAFDSATSDGYNILIDGVAGGDIQGITFTNCWSGSSDNAGLYIRSAEGVRWTAGKIINNDKHGIVLDTGASNVSIDNSDIISNSLESAGTYHNILIADNVKDYSITNNHIGTMWGWPGSAGYGVLMGTAGTRYIITGNTIINNANGAIAGGVLSGSQLISNNVGDTDLMIGNIYWNDTADTLDYYNGSTRSTIRFINGVYGEAYIYDNAVNTVIETANTPIALRQITTGLVSGWSFDAGSTGGITAYADGTGGTVLVSDAAHGLSDGDVITIRGTTDYNGAFVVSAVTTDTFKITDTWVNDNGASDWDQGSSLIAGVDSAGDYTVNWQMSTAPVAAMSLTWNVYVNEVCQCKTTAERKYAINDLDTGSSSGVLTIAAGDVVWLAVQSDGTADILNKHGNFNMHKLC